MNFPIEQIRKQFPALNREINGQKVVIFDGPSGTQMAEQTIKAMTKYMRKGNANLGGQYITAVETEELVENTRQAMADLLGGFPHEIAFGMNMTSLAFDISRALSRSWTSNDNIIVTELDHRANVDTWIEAAKDRQAEVRWIKMNPNHLVLDLDNLEELIDQNTKLMAIGHASNGVGTINNVSQISKIAHNFNSIVVVDAVHSVPHLFIDRDTIGADIILCSAYKFFGPHIGVASIREPLFQQLDPYKITTSPSYIPDKLETGTQSFESLAGVEGAVNFIASLGNGRIRRHKIKDAYSKIQDYESYLVSDLREFLMKREEITLYQAPKVVPKTPTIAFRVVERTPKEVCEFLAAKGIYAGDGHFYAKTIGDILDLNSTGGWIRIGMAPYNTIEEVNRFKEAMMELLN